MALDDAAREAAARMDGFIAGLRGLAAGAMHAAQTLNSPFVDFRGHVAPGAVERVLRSDPRLNVSSARVDDPRSEQLAAALAGPNDPRFAVNRRGASDPVSIALREALLGLSGDPRAHGRVGDEDARLILQLAAARVTWAAILRGRT